MNFEIGSEIRIFDDEKGFVISGKKLDPDDGWRPNGILVHPGNGCGPNYYEFFYYRIVPGKDELPDVQCKDCAFHSIMRMVNSNDLRYEKIAVISIQNSYIRFCYCPKVEMIVDPATIRKCGCFTKFERTENEQEETNP